MDPLDPLGRVGFVPLNVEEWQELGIWAQEVSVRGTLTPVGAKLLLRHRFVSAEETSKGVVYRLALPRDGALRRFWVANGEGLSVHSEIKLSEAAWEEYERVMFSGVLETIELTHREGHVSLPVGEVRPGETVTVALELLCGVETKDQSVRFRFPFTMVPSFSWVTGTRLVGDGSGGTVLLDDELGDLSLPPLSADEGSLHQVKFDVGLKMSVPVAEVSSPSHPVEVQLGEEGPLRAALAPEDLFLNRDLVLDVRLSRPLEGILWGKGEDDARHFAAMIPSKRFGTTARPKRRIVFAIDRSSSMGGPRIEAAQRAVLACLGQLEEEDEVNVITFADTVKTLLDGMEKAIDDVKDRLRRAVLKIELFGGTQLPQAITKGVELLGSSGGELFLITDGDAYDAENLPHEVFCSNVRIHCLGIGAAKQDRPLERLSRSTEGLSRLVPTGESVDAAALDLLAASGAAVARSLDVVGVGKDGVRILPRPPRTLAAGRPLIVWGELGESENGSIELSWQGAAAEARMTLDLDSRGADEGPTVALLRGARLIADAESVFRLGVEESITEFEALAERFSLVNRAATLSAALKWEDEPDDEEDEESDPPSASMVITEGMGWEPFLVQGSEDEQDVQESDCDEPDDEEWDTFSLPVAMPEGLESGSFLQLTPHCGESKDLLSSLSPETRFNLGRSGLPGFLPRDHSSLEDWEETAKEIGAELEEDGGLHGLTLAERIVATLAASLFLGALVEYKGAKRWEPDLQRMLEFLHGVRLVTVQPECRDLAAFTLEMVKGRSFPNPAGSQQDAWLNRLGDLIAFRADMPRMDWQAHAWEEMQELMGS